MYLCRWVVPGQLTRVQIGDGVEFTGQARDSPFDGECGVAYAEEDTRVGRVCNLEGGGRDVMTAGVCT